MHARRLVAVLLAFTVATALAHPDDDPAEARAKEIASLVVEEPDVPAATFAKEFLAAVPTAKMEQLLAGMWKEGGKVVSVKRVSGDRLHGRFTFVQERGARTDCTINVGEAEPHKISGLYLKPLGPAAHSLAELEKEAAKLPGKVSFAVARLGSRSPAALAAVNPDEPLAIGSAFKLWVLGQLIEDVAQGKRRWTDVVPLRAERRSLPSGMLHTWPEGSPVTLHSLASLMISISDNTATDHLVAVLGRERIERHLAAMGAVTSPRSVPLLMTSDMFRLKWGRKKDAAKRYLESDLAGKRALLAQLDKDPLPEVGAITAEPKHISELEWFASANDLVRTMDWLRAATAKDENARGTLGINNAGLDANGWRWIGFKGGSEPGVLELAWLLQRNDGAWFAVCIGANDPKGAVDGNKVGSIANRAVELLAEAKPARVY